MPRTRTNLLMNGDRSVNVNQSTKLGVDGSAETPATTTISSPLGADFKVAPVEVLKFKPGLQDVVSTLCGFDNSKAGSFIASDLVLFDGVMKLKTAFTIPMELLQDGAHQVWAGPIDKTINIERIEVK